MEPSNSELNAVKAYKNSRCIQITKNLYLNDKIADIFFLFDTNKGKVRIPAHKVILAGGSDVFTAMFFSDLQEKGDVKVVDASIESFKEFLQFFYLDKVTLSFDNVTDIMNLANKYMVPECSNICDEFLKDLPIKDVCFIYELALTFSRNDLVKFCDQEIRINAEEVLASDGFQQCSLNVLRRILKLNYLECHEIDVFNACMKWASYACEKANEDPSMMSNRRKQLGDCLRLIQISLMNKKTIYECVHSYKDLFDKDEVLELFDIVMSDDRNAELNIFDRYTRKICCDIEYDLGNDDSTEDSTDVYYCKKREVTQFVSNKKVILRAFETYYSNVHRDPDDMSAMVSVVTTDSSTILIQQKVQCFLNKNRDRSEIFIYGKLMEGFTIQPNKLYEIRIEFNYWENAFEESEIRRSENEQSLMNLITDENANFKVTAMGGIIDKFHFDNVKQK